MLLHISLIVLIFICQNGYPAFLHQALYTFSLLELLVFKNSSIPWIITLIQIYIICNISLHDIHQQQNISTTRKFIATLHYDITNNNSIVGIATMSMETVLDPTRH